MQKKDDYLFELERIQVPGSGVFSIPVTEAYCGSYSYTGKARTIGMQKEGCEKELIVQILIMSNDSSKSLENSHQFMTFFKIEA